MKASKGKRKIIVKGNSLLWQLPNNWENTNQWLWVGKPTGGGNLLIDPYPHDFEIRPKMVAQAIECAIEKGWKPSEKENNMKLKYENGKFTQLNDSYELNT